MASRAMTQRVAGIVDATYRALEIASDTFAISVTRDHADALDLWSLRYADAVHLNHMVRLGYPDRVIEDVFNALRPELRTEKTMTAYATWVRRRYPAPKTDALTKIAAFEQRRSTMFKRAQQEIEIARNQALCRRLCPALY